MSRVRALLTHRRLPLVVALAAAAVLWLPPLLRGAPFREVTVEEAAALVGRPGVAVLDANAREVFEVAHLPGARHVSPLALSAGDLPADRASTLLFYCKNPH